MGFLSQLAAARSSGQALGGLAGLQLKKTGFEEQRALEDEIRRIEEFEKAELQSAKKREGRRGRGRLAGLLAGAGLAMATGGTSLAIGLAGGLGSAAGQELGARGLGTSAGLGSRKRRLGRISKGLKAPGLFFGGKRKDIETMRTDLNKFLGDADRHFNQKVLTSAAIDAFSAYRAGGTNLAKFARSTDAEGNVLGLIKGFKAMKTADASRLLASGVSSAATPSLSDLGISMNPNYSDARDAYLEIYPNKGKKSLDFLEQDFNLPGQGFGDFYYGKRG